MGNQQSQMRRRSSTDVYMHVHEQEAGFVESAADSHLNPKIQPILPGEIPPKRQIANHGIAAVWSARNCQSDPMPLSRTGFFYVTDEINEIVYIGFGQLREGSLTNEIWAFNRRTFQWRQLEIKGEEITPRTASRAVLYRNCLVVFGGKDEFNYYNDMYSIDLSTLEAKKIETKGDVPSPRCGSVIGSYQNKILIWSGYTGTASPSPVHILDTNTMEWHKVDTDLPGRSAAAFVQDGNLIYACGSAKAGGLVTIDIEKETITFTETEGSEPIGTVTNAGLTKINDYLIFSGGQSASNWSLVYALDISNKTWFIVHIVPDGRTVTEKDGNITETGVFMIPRTFCNAVSFNQKTRILYSFLGSPMRDPIKIYTLDLGNAIAVMHLRDDLLTEFHKNEVGDTIDD